MTANNSIGGFNTTIQKVDDRFEWINDMIRHRQQIVLMFMQLVNHENTYDPAAEPLDPLDPNVDPYYNPALVKQVTSFCENLTDYISHGHFDLYPKILELLENASGRSLAIVQKVLPRLNKTTEPLMDFSDRFAEEQSPQKFKDLRQRLAEVGSELEIRFRMEDRLIIGLRLVQSLMSHEHLPSDHQKAKAAQPQ